MADKLTKAELKKFVALEQKRKTIQRQADTVEREAKPLKEKIRSYVEEHGGQDRTCVHHGYVIALVQHGSSIEWKSEFLAIAGEAKVIEVQNSAPAKYRLSVEPAAA